MDELVVVDKVHPHISVIRMNRPERRNAMSFEMMTRLSDAIAEIAADNTCWVAILTGTGEGFCSGLDLEDSGMIPGIDDLPLSRIGPIAMRHFSKIVPEMRAIPQPIIAAVNGAAFGGGMCLSLGTDIRYADQNARFNATGIVNGLASTELGASFMLPRLIGASRANELLLTGRTIDADEAERIGLVSSVVDTSELLDRCVSVAERMCDFSPYGLEMTKRACWDGLESTTLQGSIDFEDRSQLLLGNTENLIECVAARKEGRKPRYSDMPRKDVAAATEGFVPPY